MRIGIDVGALSIRDERLRVGVYWITRNLVREVSNLRFTDTFSSYSFQSIESESQIEFGKNCVKPVIGPKLGWSRLWLPLQLVLHPVDVYLGVSQALPTHFGKSIGFIYDLGFLTHPDLYHGNADKLSLQTHRLIERSDAIITISHSVADEIVSTYRIDPYKVHVAYLGTNTLFTPLGTRVHRKKPFFLYVGALKRPKNIPTLLRAFAYFLQQTQKEYELVCIGSTYWQMEEVQLLLDELHITQKVILLGQLPQETIATYYRQAVAFVSPSIVEGFCMPVVEAMACGCPVIVSDIPVFREIVSQAGQFTSTFDAHQLAHVMLTTAGQKNIAKYQKLGIMQAKKYTWKRMAETVSSVIDLVI